ncbi:hypothetical protein PMI22_05261 [Pseudomonas sp. GM21]|jgi:hypothetical protein|uniref:Uncharacterized protein n=1 Tax=Pseudomonas fluorescens TaxID=294 RepID=A0A5E7GW79_PSEFL|nr:hypothetical protein PMI22_05261 [Pseudomonas sp. GM21]MDR6926342.1 hypothetical protein [Pseudomonas sp. BE134]MDR7282700.1 hypothetical protein [Pseudomonas corrugata]VVO56139.1 hypothetical protein PS880_00555 [Pseudomonas fluorescens]
MIGMLHAVVSASIYGIWYQLVKKMKASRDE